MASDNTAFTRGYSAAFFAPLRYAGWAAATCFILVVTAWVVQYWTVHQVWAHDATRLEHLLAREGQQTLASLGVESVRLCGADFGLWLHKWLIEMTGLGQYIARDQLPASSAGMLERFFGAVLPGVEVASTSTKLVGVRVTALLASLPVVVLGYGLGCVVGLAERVVRRAEGGRESSTRYHHSKYYLVLLAGSTTLVYVASPVFVPLVPLMLAMAVLAFALARMQWMYLKKYI